MTHADIERWLITTGRMQTDAVQLVADYIDQCRAAGFPLSRFHIGLMVLHPVDMSYVINWTEGRDVMERRIPNTSFSEQQLQQSPFGELFRGAEVFTCRLDEVPADELPYALLQEMKAEGHTHYIAHGLKFSDGQPTRAVSYATKRPGGFTDDEMASLQALVPALSAVCELRSHATRALTLLNTYLGPKTGRQVLDGKIARGDGESIDAVVWMCDLRNFTRLSETLARDVLLDVLNDYFGAMTQAVEEHEGEVLKFIGDAMLAIFPVQEKQHAACARAMKAVERVLQLLHDCNQDRRALGAVEIDFGIALHLGQVHYGNIGGRTRLDFTVIGPAVNLASRIESKTKELGQQVLVSRAFFDQFSDGLTHCATVTLKGVQEPQDLYQRRLS